MKKFTGKPLLNGLAIVIALMLVSPLITLIFEGFNNIKDRISSLDVDETSQLLGTIKLLLGTAIGGGILGTTNGWLLANCRFPGRRILKIAQLLPLASPAYLLSATLIDLGSLHAIRIYGIYWGILIMTVTTYPYVFLLSTESFSKCGKRQLEACRSLGIGPWNSFRRVALPIAMPAIGAGVALMSMEVINELGAVQLLNIPSISAGIVESWVVKGNPSGAIGLALIALLIVTLLLLLERIFRSKIRRWSEGIAGGDSPAWKLQGIRAISAQLLALLPPAFSLGIPVLWILTNLERVKVGLNLELLMLTSRSFALGIITACITLIAGLLITIAKRWNPSNYMKGIAFFSGIGYAIPGVVLALAIQSFGGSPWNIAPIFLLLWGYSNRFLAVAKGGIDAALERLPPSLDEAATSLGYKWPQVLRKVHLPLLKGPMLVGSLLVFVDTIKELPLTFVLRPFDFDTLSVRLFQYASDERMAESILPTMMILILGLIASLALIPELEKNEAD